MNIKEMANSYRDDEIEANLLFILTDNPGLIDVAELEEQDFNLSQHQQIFTILKGLRDESREINLATLGIELSKLDSSISDFIGRVDKNDSSVLPSMFAEYSNRVKELSVNRQIRAILTKYKNPAIAIPKIEALKKKLETKKVKKLDEAFDDYLVEYEERKNTNGLSTGFPTIDKYVMLSPGDLVIIAARPSIGKTALAMNIAKNAAQNGKRVLFISAEMSVYRLLDRLLAILSSTPCEKFKHCTADLTLESVKPSVEALKNNLSLIYVPTATSEDVTRIITKENSKNKIDLVIVDYLQYLSDKAGKNDNGSTRVATITRNLKGVAGNCELALIALSQVNRAAGNNMEGMPNLSQLRESGAIEQDADTVLIFNREERDDRTGKIVIAKNRNGQPNVTVTLDFDSATTACKEKTSFTAPKPVEAVSFQEAENMFKS